MIELATTGSPANASARDSAHDRAHDRVHDRLTTCAEMRT